MNRLTAYKYQLHECKASLIAFILILIGLMALAFISISIIMPKDYQSETFSGFEFSSYIFLFVMGIASFKDTFFMMIQNGVTRKSLFLSQLAVMGTIAVIMSIINKVLLLISSAIASGIFNMNTVYNEIFYFGENPNTVSMFVLSFLLEVCISLLAIAAGYMIRIVFYRLNRLGKILVGAGLPALWFFIIPLLDFVLFDAAISKAFFGSFLVFLFGTPMRSFISLLMAFAICSGVSCLLMRKATIK